MKKLIVFLLMVSMCVVNIPIMPVYAAETNITVDGITLGYSVSESRINKGDFFALKVSVNSLVIGVKDTVEVKVLTDEYFKMADTSAIAIKKGESHDFVIQYLGTKSKLPINIIYEKDGIAGKITKFVNLPISELVTSEDSGSPSPSPSPSKVEARLIIENANIPVAKAGEPLKIPLVITNNSLFMANNITARLIIPAEAQSAIDTDSLNMTQKINMLFTNKSETITFTLNTNSGAAGKTYPIGVELKYYSGSSDITTSSETIYVKITNSSTPPTLTIQNVSTSPEVVNAGGDAKISFNLSNIGGTEAKDIKVSLVDLKKDGFTVLKGSSTSYYSSIKENQAVTLNYILNAAEKMESGNNSIGLKLEYKDTLNNKYTDEQTIFINVLGKGKGTSTKLAIKNISLSSDSIKANDSFKLSFAVNNEGKAKAENVKVTVKPEEGILLKTQDTMVFEEIAPGASQSADFMLYASDQLKSKSYNMQISIEYDDPTKENAKITVSQYASVYVDSSNSKLTPKIIINRYSFEPGIVRAGENFTLDMSFMNTSSAKTVRNIKIFLTGINSDKEGKIVFTPINSSNTFFIDSIAPKGTASETLEMYTIPDALPMTYTITANFEYQDEEGTEYKATELIGIPVIQQSKMDAGEINLPPEFYIGQPAPVNIQYFNKGKTKLSNLMIKVEGDFEIQNKNVYIGNFESGASDSFEATIIPQKPGALNGRFIFTFDDPSGETQEFIRDFAINVIEMPPMPPQMEMPMEQPSIKDKIMNMTIKNKLFWIGIVVAGAAVFTAVKLIKKRRNGIELDE